MHNGPISTPSQLFEAGRAQEAIASLTQEVRARPMDGGMRYLLAELLCFIGDWDRADKQLDVLVHQDPKVLPGVTLFQLLLRAARARQQFFSEGRLPDFVAAPGPLLQLYLQASIRIREGEAGEADEILTEAESQRLPLSGICNGQAVDDFRDLDDLTAGVLETFTAAGKYYWIPQDQLVGLRMQAPNRPRDLLWRPARIDLKDGSEIGGFLPVIYPGSEQGSDSICLGRTTEWQGGSGSPVRGLGQRMFLGGEQALGILEIQELTTSKP